MVGIFIFLYIFFLMFVDVIALKLNVHMYLLSLEMLETTHIVYILQVKLPITLHLLNCILFNLITPGNQIAIKCF